MPANHPPLDPEPGWTEVHPFPFMEARRTFTGAQSDPDLLTLRYFRRPDGELAAKVWFGPLAEGAPGRTHGGGVLTVLDEAMGAAAWVRGWWVLTVRMSTTFRKGVPTETAMTVETRVGEPERLIKAGARLLDASGIVYAESEGVFARLSPSQMREVFGDQAGRST